MLGWLWGGIPVGLSSGGRVPVWSFLHKTSQPFYMIVHPSILSRSSDIHEGSEQQTCPCCAVSQTCGAVKVAALFVLRRLVPFQSAASSEYSYTQINFVSRFPMVIDMQADVTSALAYAIS